MNKAIFFLFIIFTNPAFSQWGILNTGTPADFNAIHVIDSLKVIAVGDSGMIFKTGDGGANWSRQYAGISNENLFSVFFITNDLGFITGQNGLLLKTINGGTTWQKNTFTSLNLNDVYFKSSAKGFMIGENGFIYTTSDGGNNWTEVFSGTTFYLNSIRFTDEQNGFIAGSNGTLLKTNDGGANWQNINTQITNTLNDLFFINKDTGLLIGLNQSIFKTTDGAKTFTSISTGFGEHFYSLNCFNNLDCHISGNKGTIIKIENLTQASKEYGNGTNIIKSIGFFNPYIGYSSGTNGTILKTCPISEFNANSNTGNLKVSFANQSRNYTKNTWLFGDGNSSVENNPTYYYKKAGDYQVKLIVENQTNCKDTISKFINVINANRFDNELIQNILITPNPFTEALVVDISLNNSFIKMVEINEPSGVCVYRKKINNANGSALHLSLEMEINKLTSGIYFLRVTTDKGIIFRKVIKL